jgi:hypothetical protein
MQGRTELSADARDKLDALNSRLSNALAEVVSANSLSPETVDMDASYRIYHAELTAAKGAQPKQDRANA